jgi:hypothetical protein
MNLVLELLPTASPGGCGFLSLRIVASGSAVCVHIKALQKYI